jgi:hypothetical protein
MARGYAYVAERGLVDFGHFVSYAMTSGSFTSVTAWARANIMRQYMYINTAPQKRISLLLSNHHMHHGERKAAAREEGRPTP